MKPDINSIPLPELIKDQEEALDDVHICRLAIQYGITEYAGRSIQARLDTNLEIIQVIENELKRRHNEA